MVSLKPSRRRIVGLASLACSAAFVVLSFASVPAGAQSVSTATTPSSCPVLSLGNPNPGDNLIPGGMFISGTAFVPGATQDSGVSRVDLFLGERDNGGTFLGSAMPGTGTSGDPRAFNVEVTIPTSVNRGLNFAAYAFSVTGGLQTTVTFPVLVGVPPAKNPAATPTPIPMVETVTSQCPGAQTSAAASSASARLSRPPPRPPWPFLLRVPSRPLRAPPARSCR